MNKEQVLQEVHELEGLCYDIAQTIWDAPEVGGSEQKSADVFRALLEKEGFRIVNEEKLPHAFYAEYGEGKPVVAVLGEYDALPGLSQTVSAEPNPVQDGGAGHACGHNLIGAGSATAAIAIKRYLEKSKKQGTVRFYGCPEEELLSGKVKMAYYGMFDGADIALSWHPMSANMTMDRAYLASASARFYFKGTTSHAGFAPERGRSALDAVELMNVGVNYLREHVIDHTRMHYSTDSGGYAPNIVPGHASSWYFVRAPRMDSVQDTLRRIKLVAEGAAMMTETSVQTKLDAGCYEMKENNRFSDLTFRNMLLAPPPEYTEEEMAFAKALQATQPEEMRIKDEKTYETDQPLFTGIAPRELWEKSVLNASSDSGDVSYIMPMNLFTTTCWPIGVAPHTWQATASTGSSIGKKGAHYAAKVMALCAYDLFNEPETLQAIQKEFAERNEVAYKTMYEA